MGKELLHIWGPFSIQSYGLLIAMGILTACYLFLKDKRSKAIISSEQFNKVITFAIIIAIFGGRALFVIEEPSSIIGFWDIFKVWEGGLSSLGTILSIIIFVPLYLKYLKIPIIKFFDLAGIYAPIIECIGRIGCYTAGCCYGAETNLPWAIIHEECKWGSCTKTYVHPTQIYSSIAAFCVFLIMRSNFVKTKLSKPGQTIAGYLMLTSACRFGIDFLRGDRIFLNPESTITNNILNALSTSQIISLLICLASFITIVLINYFHKKNILENKH